MKPLVIIESPYAGNISSNVDYARSCCQDSYRRGEQPFASHLLYPQFMDDGDLRERQDGIAFGYNLWKGAHKVAFYTDEGWSPGMLQALEMAIRLNSRLVVVRTLFRRVFVSPAAIEKAHQITGDYFDFQAD